MKSGWLSTGVVLVSLFVWQAIAPLPGYPGGGESSPITPGHSYLILSQDFWQAMEKLAKGGVTYGDRRESLLEQIAVSARYTVRTNLTLIKQNERIINLLEEINRRQLQEGR